MRQQRRGDQRHNCVYRPVKNSALLRPYKQWSKPLEPSPLCPPTVLYAYKQPNRRDYNKQLIWLNCRSDLQSRKPSCFFFALIQMQVFMLLKDNISHLSHTWSCCWYLFPFTAIFGSLFWAFKPRYLFTITWYFLQYFIYDTCGH